MCFITITEESKRSNLRSNPKKEKDGTDCDIHSTGGTFVLCPCCFLHVLVRLTLKCGIHLNDLEEQTFVCVRVCLYFFFHEEKKGLAEVCFWMVGWFFFCLQPHKCWHQSSHIKEWAHVTSQPRVLPYCTAGINRKKQNKAFQGSYCYCYLYETAVLQRVGVKNREGVCVCVSIHTMGGGGVALSWYYLWFLAAVD